MPIARAVEILFLLLAIPMTVAADKPVVIAHRGASGYLPEHTLEAKALAFGMGADYLEQDVVLSRDHVPIVLHDIHLDTVTNVAEVWPDRARDDGRYYAIDFTLAEIQLLAVTERIDVNTGKAVYPGRFPVGSAHFRIPSLEEELQFVQGLNRSTGKNVGIYTEVKKPAWHREQNADISRIVVDLLHRYGYRDKQDNGYLQCFDAAESERMRNELGTKLKIVQLIGKNNGGTPSTDFDQLRTPSGLQSIAEYADGIGPDMSLVVSGVDGKGAAQISSLVADAHKNGLVVHPYTFRADGLPEYADSYERLLEIFLVEAGCDGLFTDFPDATVRFRDAMPLPQR